MTAGRIPMFRVPGPASADPAAPDAWECADCGWAVDAAHLAHGWTVAGARAAHVDWYCASPSPWP